MTVLPGRPAPRDQATESDLVAPASADVTRARGWSAADAAVALSLVGLLAYSWYLGRGLTYYADDWNFVIGPVHLLQPHFGHLSLVPKVLYQGVLAAFGLGSYAPYRLMACVAFAAFGVTFYLYLRARVSPWFAAILAIGFIWFSRMDLFPTLFVVMINYTIPLATTIGIWALLDRRTAKADWAASGLMAVGLASSAVGVIAIVAVGAEFLFGWAPLRRWMRFAPPVLLWLVWYAKYHESLGDVGTVRQVASFAFHELYYTFAAFVGGNQVGGCVLAAVVVLGIAVAVRQHVARPKTRDGDGGALPGSHALTRRRGWVPDLREATVTPRAAGAVAAAIGFAFATALSRKVLMGQVQTPDVARYLWVIGIFLAVALVDCCKHVRFGPLVAAVAVVGLVANGVHLVQGLDEQRATRFAYQHKIVPLITATQALGIRTPNRILPITIVVLRADEYVTTVSQRGAPPGTTGQPIGYEKYQLIADSWMTPLVSAQDVPPGSVLRDCRSLPAARPFHAVAGSAVLVRAGASAVQVRVRRFATTFANPAVEVLAPHTDSLLTFAHDSSPVPWTVRLTPGGSTAAACSS